MADGSGLKESGPRTAGRTTRGARSGWSIQKANLRQKICCRRGLPLRLREGAGFRTPNGSTKIESSFRWLVAPDASATTVSMLETAATKFFALAAATLNGHRILKLAWRRTMAA